jgi:outer membrane receptor for ferric coprogen and ferric-rhodotorulic acid
VYPQNTNKRWPFFALRPVQGVGLSVLALALSFSPLEQVVAQDVPVLSISIPAQSLNQALLELGQQADIQIYYLPDTVSGLQAAPVSGRMTPQQALQSLLKGTGVQASWKGRTVSLTRSIRDDTTQLAPITVTANTGLATEGSGSYVAMGPSTSASGLELSLRETPQSMTVITHQKIEDKNYRALDESLRDAPGIVAVQGNGDSRWEYLARGHSISNIQYDGITTSTQSYSRDILADDDLAMYDRVEIVRGATGLLEGSGNPSASVNLIRKRPTSTPQYSARVTASSWENARGVVDLSNALNESGTVRGRAVIVAGGGKLYRDYNRQKEQLFYGVVDVDLTPATTLSLGLSRQRQHNDGYSWGGFPTRADGSFYDLSPHDFLGSDWEYLDRRQTTLYADLEHRFDNGWVMKALTRAAWAESDYVASYPWYTGGALRKFTQSVDMRDKHYAFNVNANGPLTLFGRDHDFSIGINANKENERVDGSSAANIPLDPENWSPTSQAKPTFGLNPYYVDENKEELGLYASARFDIADPLKLILGGRVSWFKSKSQYYKTDYSADAEFVPYVGLVYDLNDTYSVYASHTGIFKPQSYYDINGSLLDPVKGTNNELGLKGEFLDKRLNASIALFQLEQLNLPTQVAGVTYCNPAVLYCYEAAEKVRTRGVELEVAGAVTDRWNVSAGYTYARSEYASGTRKGELYNERSSPENMVKIFSTYRLGGALDGLTLGGGVRWQSKVFYKGSNFRIEQPGYAIVDLLARYDFNRNTSVQLNIDNLSNKQYYSKIGSSISTGNYLGKPRQVLLTVSHRF